MSRLSMFGRLKSGGIAAAVAAMMAGAGAAHAFPNEPVTIVSPFPPGGIIDQVARPLAQALERIWDSPVVVENRPGAGGGIGKAAVANARPDGHTLLVTHPAMVIIPAADALVGRDPVFTSDQFVPIGRVTADPLVFVVRADSAWETMDEFVADAQTRPGEIAYASSGVYGGIHIPTEMLAHAADMELNHVPYSGGGPMVTALLGGEVDAIAAGPGPLAPYIEDGTFRPLLQTGGERIAIFPDLQTAQELGYDVEFYLWAGVFASSQVPDETLEELRDALAQAVEEPGFVETLEDNYGVPIQYLTAEEFEEFLREDAERIEAALQRIGRIE